MKTSSVLKMALMALLLEVGFASCNNNNKSQTVEKKLVKMTTEYVSKDVNTGISRTFSYDTDGRLKEATICTVLHSNDTVTRTYKYVWNTDSINVTEEISLSSFPAPEPRQLKYTMNISDGLVRAHMYEKDSTERILYNYDASNRLQHTYDGYSNIYNEWDNDKLISITRKSESDYISTFTYGESRPVKGYLPLVPNEIPNEPLFFAHPELGGMKTSQIFVSKTITFSNRPDLTDNTYYCEYEFDKDGYISQITSTNKPNVENSTATIYTFTWE